MWKHFLCLMSMLLTLTAWGCSLAPQPVARPVTGQQTLEAVDHWRILAQQIVKEMQLTTGSSVYVSEQDRSPFRAGNDWLNHLKLHILYFLYLNYDVGSLYKLC